MAEYVRASQIFVVVVLVLLAATEIASSQSEASQFAAPSISTRVNQVSSRGSPRPAPPSTPESDLLVYRAQPIASPTAGPTAVPAPSPTVQPPEPTREPDRRDLGTFTVTAYSDSPRNGTNGLGVTKSGIRTHWGVVAVDPMVVPLHSQVIIEGMGDTVFTALDTGGGVSGKWVDIWYPTDWDAVQHGVRQARVYLLP